LSRFRTLAQAALAEVPIREAMMARAYGWKVALVALVLLQGLAGNTAVSGQEFVVRDRLAEARARVIRERMAGQHTPAQGSVAEAQTMPEHAQPFPIEPLSLQLNPAVGSYAATDAVENSVVEVPASGFHGESPPVWQEPTNNEVWTEPAVDAGWMPVADTAAGSRPVLGELEPGPYDYSWRRDIPGVVLTNTHWHDGPRGEGYAAPFGYSSAYCRSGTGPQQDARGNPSFCDEWKTPCGCSCCDEPFGLDIFKSRPYGAWPQKKHGCGCQTNCNGCAEGTPTCGGLGGDAPARSNRLGLPDEPLFSIR
jgi:hypothetical protein